jgi:hypothetical protein
MRRPFRRLPHCEVAEVPNLIGITRASPKIPAVDQFLIHLGD